MKKLIAKYDSQLNGGYLLLVLLIIQLFIVAVLPIRMHALIYDIVLTLIYLSLTLVIDQKRTIWFFYIIVLIVMEWLFELLELAILSQISYVLTLFLFPYVILRFIAMIMHSKKVNALVLLQSINAYLLLGLLSSIAINFIITFNPSSFNFPDTGLFADGVSRLSEFQYYGLVTISTLGFGDITPATPLARSVSTFITIIGQLYIAIILAMLVGKYSGESKK